MFHRTITQGYRAADLFVDREPYIRTFCEQIHQPTAQVLFFHGIGGIGKSLLLRKLRADYCVKLVDPLVWEHIVRTGRTDRAWLTHFEQADDTLPIGSALLDFDRKKRTSQRAIDNVASPFYAMMKLRRQLRGYTLPLFDYAVISYLSKQGQLDEAYVRQLFPADALDVVEAMMGIMLAPAAPFMTLGKAIYNLFDKRVDERTTLWRARLKTKLSEAEVTHIARIQEPYELIEELPRLLAHDLQTAVAAQAGVQKLVLFFDTYEGLWDDREKIGTPVYFERDRWLRQLIAGLWENGALGKQVVVVMAGRDVPHWPDADDGFSLSAAVIDLHLVGNLSKPDGTHYLELAGMTDAALREHIYDQSYGVPFYLGLSADIYLAAAKRGQPLTVADFPVSITDRNRQLVSRFMRYTTDNTKQALHALSAARTFDAAIFDYLGEQATLAFDATATALRTIQRFSFVTRVAEGRYQLHALFGDLLESDAVQQAAHVALADYYAGQPEALYHRHQFEPEAAEQAWLDQFEQASLLSQHETAALLQAVREVLKITPSVRLVEMLWCEGDYLARLARHATVKQRYETAFHITKALPISAKVARYAGIALRSLGKLSAELSRHAEAMARYEAAVASFDAALRLAPEYAAAHNNKGLALRSWGDLSAKLSQRAEAVAQYEAAAASFDAALRLVPEDVAAHNNKGNVLQNWGDLSAKLSQHAEAVAQYEAAVASFDAALRLAPKHVVVRNNKGLVLRSWGDLSAELSQHAEAVAQYEAAVASYDTALRLARKDVFVLNNKGSILRSWGDLSATLSQHAEAMTQYKAAVASFDAALRLAPEYVAAHTNKGLALKSWGGLSAHLSQHAEAMAQYEAAVASYDIALHLAPEHVSTLNNRGIILIIWGELSAHLSQHAEAVAQYEAGVASFDAALHLAPEHVAVHNNKGNALKSWGELSAHLSQHAEAMAQYEAAVASYDIALHLAPEHVSALNGKGRVLKNWGYLAFDLSQYKRAMKLYAEAVASFDIALQLAPESRMAHLNRGLVMQGLGELLSKLGWRKEAKTAYKQAAISYDVVLSLSPRYSLALASKGKTLEQLGTVYLHDKNNPLYVTSWIESATCFQKLLQITPNDTTASNNLTIMRRRLEEALADEALSSDAAAAIEAWLKTVED